MNLEDICAQYEAATDEFLRAATGVSEEQLDLHPEGGWSARQIIHHVADSEAQSYARLRRLLAEPAGTLIQGYDEAAWAANDTLGYETLPPQHSLAVFEAVRTATLDILGRLTPEDLSRSGQHSESGRYDVATWVETYLRHPLDHAAQIRDATKSSPN
jgi:DinB superfamily